MNIYIYDIEVFRDDWIVIFKRPEKGSNHIVIHNDNNRLREFLTQPDIVIGGFNNKHYDDYIVKTMINGGRNYHVKKHNDFIISGGEPWKYSPFDYKDTMFKRLPCPTFDLRDDIADKGISLKAIEGNLKLPIVESSVPFNIDRPLTQEELKEVIRYCKYDVDSTIKLYWERKENYLDAKSMVGEMYGVPTAEALGMTNAKLSARVLEAHFVKRDDERDYVIPDNIDTNYIPKIVLDFFMQIRDKSIPDEKLFGAGKGKRGSTLKLWFRTAYGSCPVTYAWGGVHGAKPCVTVTETDNRVIINQDVGSLYPNSMINFGYCSRSMKDPDAYVKLVKKRLGYKKAGDTTRAAALKLVVNTVYGAMLNLYNDLADRWAGRSVCISNQLAMTVLIVQLAQQCSSIDFVNINTDGIMFTIDRSEVEKSEQIVASWCEITKFEMERDDFVKVIQKDVNNYIGIKSDGKIKTKGGFVSLYKGGNFKTNSLSIIHKAVVEYLINGIPPEKTISECDDIFAFQNIVKTGSTYSESCQYFDGYLVPLQKVNRIYAVKNKRYGVVVKRKYITTKNKKDKSTGKMIPYDVEPYWQEDTISECPEHAYVDNENVLTVKDLDLGYYVDMAKKRIDKYIHIDKKVENDLKKITEEIVIMATEKNNMTKASVQNVFSKLLEARKRFLEAGIKKEGVNRYAEFKYFRLDEIIPVKQQIFHDLGLADIITFGQDTATLTLVNVDDPDDFVEFDSQLAPDESMIKNPIQKVGAVQTYVRRYLYLLMLDIIESDSIDAVSDKPENNAPAPTTAKKVKPVSQTERTEAKAELTATNDTMTKTQKTAITNGLKKLRARYMDENKVVTNETLEARYDTFIKNTVKRVKAGLTKTEAENLLIEIGEKIVEE